MANFQRIFGEDGLPYLIDTSDQGLNESDNPFSSGYEFLDDSEHRWARPIYGANDAEESSVHPPETYLPFRSEIDSMDTLALQQENRPRGLLSLADYDLARNSLSLQYSDILNENELPENRVLKKQFNVDTSAYMPGSEPSFRPVNRQQLFVTGFGGADSAGYCSNDAIPLFGYPSIPMSKSRDLFDYSESSVPNVLTRAPLPFPKKSILEVNAVHPNDNAAGFMRFLQSGLKNAGVTTDVEGEQRVRPLEKYPEYGIDYNKLYAPKAAAYRKNQIIQDSHINTPIDYSSDRPAGRSRISGDADPAVQRAAINVLIEKSKQAGLNEEQTALVLAIAHKESGFNPDAAAGTSSATGLGQFTNATRKRYGLDDSKIWDMDAQADALIKLTVENAAIAKKKLRGLDYVYKYHHDGPNKRESNGLNDQSEGLSISRNEIMPRAKNFLRILRGE